MPTVPALEAFRIGANFRFATSYPMAVGIEPVSVAKRALARVLSQPDVSGTHETAPDGFLIAYGASVRAGRVRLGRLVDVTPTILYFLGLPVARDMDGDARTDVFTRTFTSPRPITYIPSYER